MFRRGRHHSRQGGRPVAELAQAARQARAVEPAASAAAPTGGAAPGQGPYDEAEAPRDELDRLDLGSVQLPLPDGAQLQVEVDPAGPVRAVHLLTDYGQLTVNAFAAPRTERLWTAVRAEITEQLQADGDAVDLLRGPWGGEVRAVSPRMAMRFVGVDGPRWLLRGVAAGPIESQAALVELLYGVLRQTIVVRGEEPMPVRTPLPITLPEPMLQRLRQLAAAQQEQAVTED